VFLNMLEYHYGLNMETVLCSSCKSPIDVNILALFVSSRGQTIMQLPSSSSALHWECFLEQSHEFLLKGHQYGGYNLLTPHQIQRLTEKINCVVIQKAAARKSNKKNEILVNLKITDFDALPLTVICIATVVKHSIRYEDKLPKELALKFKDYLYLENEKKLLQIQMKPIEMRKLLLKYNITLPSTKKNINSEMEDEIILALVNKTIPHNFEIPVLSSKKRLEFSDNAENEMLLLVEENQNFDGQCPTGVEEMEHVVHSWEESPGKRIQSFKGSEEPERKRKKSPK